MILLAAVTLVSTVIVGGLALLEPAPAQQTAQAAAPSYLMDTTPVRVVGAPFVPNTDPHRR